MKTSLATTLAAALVAQSLSPAFAQTSASTLVSELARNARATNVILFIGDGMGDSEITIARNYQLGANGRLALDTLPLTGTYTTHAVHEDNPAIPDYVTDSAASGTAWATGRKTSNGRISTRPGSTDIAPYVTILELAQKAGFATGNVSTAELTDATPAVLASHINARGCQGPQDMSSCTAYKKANGGPGSIAEQEVDHKLDVLLGGGYQRFAQTIDGGPHNGKTVVESAELQGYTVVRTAAELAAYNAPGRLLGLFSTGNMALEWGGDIAAPHPGSGPQSCIEGQRPADQPSVADMTRSAIQVLERAKASNNKRGFFLQVEGASIDKQDHASHPCAQIGELIAFDNAVQIGLNYAANHPDTLVIVTADHGHTSQIIDMPASAAQPGAFSILKTKEGGTMAVSYASAPVGASQSHTGTQVRTAAQGPQAYNVLGVIDQSDLFYIMGKALGLPTGSH